MTDYTLPQSLLSLLDVSGVSWQEDQNQPQHQGPADALNPTDMLADLTAGLEDRFVYTPAPAGLANTAGPDANSSDFLHMNAGQSSHPAFDDWVNLLAPWAQAGAATFVSSAVDPIHDAGLAVAADLHNAKGSHSP